MWASTRTIYFHDLGMTKASSTRHDRQSAALFLAPDIQLNVILYVANSSPHLFTLLLAFFPFRNFASGLWLFLTVMSVP